MPTDTTKNSRERRHIITYQGTDSTGETLLQWPIPEFLKHYRGKLWYLIAAIIAALLLLYAFVTLNFLFAVIIIIATVIIIIEDRQRPRTFDFQITDRGIIIGPKFYPYKQINRFWIIYEPPEVKNLYFSFKALVRNNVTIPLEDTNPLEVRDTLLDFAVEDLDQENEAPSDSLRRLLKF